jgi:hypothetical protein
MKARRFRKSSGAIRNGWDRSQPPLLASLASSVVPFFDPIGFICGKWQSPDLMDKWQFDSKHTPMQDAAHARWFSSIYIRKWRLPDTGEQMTGPLFCEIAIARQAPIDAGTLDKILDEIVGPSLRKSEALPFETLTGVFEA